jgi:hypothetical protein
VPPKNHRGIVVCNAKRAEQWRKAFHAAGIEAVVVETIGEEAEGGACKVMVPERKLIDANAIVTAVNQGKRSLPGIVVPWQALIASVLVLAMLGALMIR